MRLLIVTHGRVMLCFRYWLEKLTVEAVESIIDRDESIGNCGVLRYIYHEGHGHYEKIVPWDQ